MSVASCRVGLTIAIPQGDEPVVDLRQQLLQRLGRVAHVDGHHADSHAAVGLSALPGRVDSVARPTSDVGNPRRRRRSVVVPDVPPGGSRCRPGSAATVRETYRPVSRGSSPRVEWLSSTPASARAARHLRRTDRAAPRGRRIHGCLGRPRGGFRRCRSGACGRCRATGAATAASAAGWVGAPVCFARPPAGCRRDSPGRRRHGRRGRLRRLGTAGQQRQSHQQASAGTERCI